MPLPLCPGARGHCGRETYGAWGVIIYPFRGIKFFGESFFLEWGIIGRGCWQGVLLLVLVGDEQEAAFLFHAAVDE